MSAPNQIKRKARYMRRLTNIQRRLGQLERDFEDADSMDAELRINEEIAQQHALLARVERRLRGSVSG